MPQSQSAKKPMLIIGGIIAAIALALFGYLMWYVAPVEVTETVKLVAITDNGCVVETADGHAITVPSCVGHPGDMIIVKYDKNIKERALAMNPPN
ncbi:MAG: hypothetical protein QXW91_06380 [Candidatus Nitrosotenuis sp.]